MLIVLPRLKDGPSSAATNAAATDAAASNQRIAESPGSNAVILEKPLPALEAEAAKEVPIWTGNAPDPISPERVEQVAQRRKRLQLIGIAGREFHDENRHSAPLALTIGGQPDHLASVHTELLPYLKSKEAVGLYDQVHFDQPWNSAGNRPAYMTPVPAYLSPLIANSELPSDYAVTHFVMNVHLINPQTKQGLRYLDIVDGMTNTLFLGQIDSNFPAWGQPGSERDTSNGLRGGPEAFGNFGQPVPVVLMDGSVRDINPQIDADWARNLGLPNDRQSIAPY